MRVPRAFRRLIAWTAALFGPLRSTKFKPLSQPKQTVEPNWEYSQDTVEGCLERAGSDLKEADIANQHEREQLRRTAERWSLRAELLERLAKSFRKRAALDEASRQYHRDKARQVPPPA